MAMNRILVVAGLLCMAVATGCDGTRTPDGAATSSGPARSAEAPADATASPATPARKPDARRTVLDNLVTADDTLDSLRKRHGADQVAAETLPGAEGETSEGWVLFPADPTRRVEIYLDESGRRPAALVVREGHTAFARGDGVRIGMSSVELEKLNGRAYSFAGFDWDYGGVVMDWRGGRLGDAEGVGRGPTVLCPGEWPDGYPAGYPVGDGEFASDLPVMRKHPATVCEVGFNVATGNADG